MPIFKTTCTSITGPYLYSDVHSCKGFGRYRNLQVPLLNRIAAIPFVGHFGALLRIALSIIHMIGHTLAALFWDSGHFYHVAKGGAEFVNGLIELIPIVGRIFVWKRDGIDWLSVFDDSWFFDEHGRYFLIKIYNPEKPDAVDHYYAKENKHPYLDHFESCDTKPFLCKKFTLRASRPTEPPSLQAVSQFLESITAQNIEDYIEVAPGIDLEKTKKGECVVTRWGNTNQAWECNFVNKKGFRDSLNIKCLFLETSFVCVDGQKEINFKNLKGILDFYLSNPSDSIPETLSIKLRRGPYQYITYTNSEKKEHKQQQAATTILKPSTYSGVPKPSPLLSA